jgi:hypothetical protein
MVVVLRSEEVETPSTIRSDDAAPLSRRERGWG